MVTYVIGILLTATLVVLIFVAAFYWQTDWTTRRGLSDAAQNVAARLPLDSFGRPGRITLPEELQWMYDQLVHDIEFRIVDEHGDVVPDSQRPMRFLPASLGPNSIRESITLHIDGKDTRVVTVPIIQTKGRYYLQIASSDRLVNFTGLSFRGPVPGSILLMVIISVPALGGLMLLMLSRLLRPLSAVSDAAARIEPHNLSARLSTEAVPTELVPLIDSFNLALTRLEQGYRVQQQFLGSAAHELKTPLALMRGQIEVEGLADRVTLLSDIDVMVRQVQQLLLLTEVSEVCNYKMELININQLSIEVITFLSRMADLGKICLSLRQSDQPIFWSGDKSAFFTLIKNLVENAIQHSPTGTTVTISIDPTGVSVRDEGCGVTAEHVPNLFKRFWRGSGRIDGRSDGAGLGLAICEEIATAHGWRLELDNAMPGAIFKIVNTQPILGNS
jgi:signal transduction histidine kinase